MIFIIFKYKHNKGSYEKSTPKTELSKLNKSLEKVESKLKHQERYLKFNLNEIRAKINDYERNQLKHKNIFTILSDNFWKIKNDDNFLLKF